MYLNQTIEIDHFKQLRLRLLEIEPDIDESTLNDTLEGLTDLHEAVGEIVRSALVDEAMVAGLKGRMGELKDRLVRFEHRAWQKRDLARGVMAECGIKKVSAPDFTLSLRPANPGVIVTDETTIPQNYWVPQPAKLDRRAILDNLKRGEIVAGAELSNPQLSLTVRTR
jgi:Siphovirus Gp157